MQARVGPVVMGGTAPYAPVRWLDRTKLRVCSPPQLVPSHASHEWNSEHCSPSLTATASAPQVRGPSQRTSRVQSLSSLPLRRGKTSELGRTICVSACTVG